MEIEKEMVHSATPIWRYAVQAFPEMMAKYCGPKGEKVSSSCLRLPNDEILCQGKVGSWESFYEVCEVSVGTNPVWKCKCSVRMADSTGPGNPPQLVFDCSSKSGSVRLMIYLYNGQLYTWLKVGEVFQDTQQYPVSDDKKGVDVGLEALVAVYAQESIPRSK
jgi:hypothetical protein